MRVVTTSNTSNRYIFDQTIFIIFTYYSKIRRQKNARQNIILRLSNYLIYLLFYLISHNIK